jgi:hypothetical protein
MQVDRIAHAHGVLSPQTWSQRLGMDYDQEQKNFGGHRVDGHLSRHHSSVEI